MFRSSRSSRRTEPRRSSHSERSSKRPRRSSPSSGRRGQRGEERTIPPVMVRSDAAAPPFRVSRRAKTKTRRHYDVALNVPGAEMRLPALPQVHLGWRLVSAVLVVSISMLLYHLWNSPTFQVSALRIVGLQRLTVQDVNSVLDLRGEPIFALDANALQAKLQNAFPEFLKVNVEIGLPNEVLVNVEERIPILTWHQGDRTILVDANGIAFPQRTRDQSTPGLVIEANGSPPAGDPGLETDSSSSFMSVEMVSAILSMKSAAPQNTPLVYDAQHGLGWRDAQGWEVYFGDVRDMDMKLRVYKALVKKLGQEGITPALVSVEYVYAPYYRMAR